MCIPMYRSNKIAMLSFYLLWMCLYDICNVSSKVEVAMYVSRFFCFFVFLGGCLHADFQHVFLKNNRDSVITEAALNEYMELFINFKLKVQAAEALGMDTIETFQRELAGYRTQLARPYLTNNDLLLDLVKQAWERQQEEVRARHILVSCGAEASAAEAAAVYSGSSCSRHRGASCAAPPRSRSTSRSR